VPQRVEERIINSTLAATALLVPLLLSLPVLAQTPAAMTSTTGRNLAAACASCHGIDGVSVDGMPALAGKPRGYLIQTLKDFRDGRRPCTIMPQLAKGYGDAQIEALAYYLAARKAAP